LAAMLSTGNSNSIQLSAVLMTAEESFIMYSWLD